MGSLNTVIHPFMANPEPSFSVIQARLLYQHYRQLRQSNDWRSLPVGVKPLRLVWDYTNIPPESAWRYLQQLAFPETRIMLSPSTLEMYRGVSLLPNHWADSGQERLVGEPRENLWDEQVERLVNAEMARSLIAFHQLLDTIEKKSKR
jgi:transaldolase/glucose-6-phosphate isomerase